MLPVYARVRRTVSTKTDLCPTSRHVFYSWILLRTSVNPRSPKPISLTRSTKGGVATDPRHISSSMAHRIEIPTATPLFSRSRNPTVLMPIPSCATGSRKSKMAAVKTKAAITIERTEISMRFQLLPPHFRPGPTWIWHYRHCPTFCDVGRQPISK